MGSPATQLLDPLSTGKLVYVDSVLGNDSTGALQRPDKPFLTMTAAKVAASAGYTGIVRPGIYNERNCLKHLVNWHFTPGAIVRYTGTQVGSIFDTSSYGTNGAVTSRITGHGVFEIATDLDNSAEYQGDPFLSEYINVLLTANAADDIYIEGESAAFAAVDTLVGFGAGAGSAIRHGKGTVECRIRRLLGGEGSGYWWTDGPAFVHADYIDGASNPAAGGYPVYLAVTPTVATAWSTGAFWLNVNNIHSLSLNGTMRMTLSAATRAWIIAKEISAASPSSGSGPMVVLDQGRMYLDAQKITGAPSGGAGGIAVGGGVLWGRIMKIGDGTAVAVTLSGGESHLEIQQIEDLSNFTSLVTCSAGTHYLKLGKATSLTADQSILVSGGTLNLIEGVIASGAAKLDLKRTGGTLNVGAGVKYDVSKISGAMNAPVETHGITLYTSEGTGSRGQIVLPRAWVVVGWDITSDISGSAGIDIKKSNSWPTSGTSICNANKPTLTTAAKANGTPSGWTAGAAGDVWEFNLDSFTTVTRVTLNLKVQVA